MCALNIFLRRFKTRDEIHKDQQSDVYNSQFSEPTTTTPEILILFVSDLDDKIGVGDNTCRALEVA